ncbi:hypothetical protein FSP39_013425 [Pinctada imbricata]|uniref:WD repeat-containing protein 17 n=1 Tax=Pinctada imbricata TaxID=66713 RepID=A0AA89C3R4_PINIB|nr:hypothetical protein FSP39_013425 [Pinctada imbricata]
MVKQIGLLPAGCQPWNTDVVATSGDRFVYCATLAIYIYQLEKKFNEFRLISIMSEHKKTINSVCFHPRTSDLIVSAGCDKCIFVWNITEQCVVAKLENVLRESPKSVSWMWTPKGEEAVCFIQGRGPLNVWPYKSAIGIYAVKEAASFPSNVCQIRWHPKNNSKVALGHMDGSVSVCVIGGKSHKCQFRHEDLEDDEEDPVMALEWDPLSHDYLMMCTTTSPTRLVDTNSLTVITKYQLPSAATKVHTLAWISGAPGMFITGDVRSGILRVWNVSRSTPIENIPIKKNGIVALQTIIVPKIREKKKDSPKHKEQTVSSTSATLAPASVNKSHFALPPAKVVCAFLDGGVGLYDLGGRKWDFLRDQGHIETIFDCDFCPYNADHLATASFDGTIKIWDINTLSFVESSSGNEGVIYSLSWAPGDLNCIVASTSKNGMFIWDVDKRKIVQRFHEHGKTTSVFCVAWNQKDSRRIMSVGADHYCIVRRVDKEIVAKYKHPAPVYGCDWSCHNNKCHHTNTQHLCMVVIGVVITSKCYHTNTQHLCMVVIGVVITSKCYHTNTQHLCMVVIGVVITGKCYNTNTKHLCMVVIGVVKTSKCYHTNTKHLCMVVIGVVKTSKCYHTNTKHLCMVVIGVVITSKCHHTNTQHLCMVVIGVVITSKCHHTNTQHLCMVVIGVVITSKCYHTNTQHLCMVVIGVVITSKCHHTNTQHLCMVVVGVVIISKCYHTNTQHLCMVVVGVVIISKCYHTNTQHLCMVVIGVVITSKCHHTNTQHLCMVVIGVVITSKCHHTNTQHLCMVVIGVVITSHTEKVFHVKWSPVREGIIASGSDDGTIRIWEYTQESCVMVLKGHTGPVRGILWNTEIPYLLMSGSWDYKILLWDVRDGACVETLLDHGADVYGLASHPNRPFTIASTSRDSTVRIWSLNSLVQPLEMNIVAGKPWNEIIGSIESAMVPGNPPLLAGKSSKEQKFDLESSGGNFREKSLIAWSKFFGTPNGTANLWELVLVNKGIADTLLSDNYKNGIVHVKHLTKFKGSEAQELQMVKMSRYGGGIGAPSREDRIRDAAKINLSIGNVQRYCELMVELGEWQHAIAIAPGVSMEYWKSLTQRYITYLQTKDSEVLIPFSTTVGDLDTLVSFYTSRGQIQDALLTAQVACEGTFSSPPLTNTSQGLCNGTDVPTKEQRRLLLNSVDALAEWYFRNGSPVLSACCYLAVDDPQKAMWKLIQGHELELAVSIGTVLGNVPEQTYLAFEYLSRRCEHLQKWDLAVDLLKLIPNNEILLIKCCARCSAGKDEIDLLHARAGIPSLERCQHEAETLKNQVQIHNSIKYYMVSPCPEEGLKLGLDEVKRIIQKPGWTVHGVFPLLTLLASMRSDKLQQHKLAQSCGELQCFCAYVGGLMAVHSGYDEIVKPLFMHARYIMSRESLNLPITDVKVNQEMEAWTAIQQKKAEW